MARKSSAPRGYATRSSIGKTLHRARSDNAHVEYIGQLMEVTAGAADVVIAGDQQKTVPAESAQFRDQNVRLFLRGQRGGWGNWMK